MARRPHANKSVFDLEAIFERSRNDAGELGRLSTELTFRNTARARSLTGKVEKAVAELARHKVVALAASGAPTHLSHQASTPSSTVTPAEGAAKVVPLRSKSVNTARGRQQLGDEPLDLGPLPAFTPSGKPSDAQAILAAWTALEALSPQSYKRPEEMASGDRSRVALLERGVPWGPHARSKPNHHPHV